MWFQEKHLLGTTFTLTIYFFVNLDQNYMILNSICSFITTRLNRETLKLYAWTKLAFKDWLKETFHKIIRLIPQYLLSLKCFILIYENEPISMLLRNTTLCARISSILSSQEQAAHLCFYEQKITILFTRLWWENIALDVQ